MDKDLITSIIGITIVWVSITGLINIMLYIWVYKKKTIHIKLPIRKKYKNKLSPIYQIKEGTLNDYVISKYKLDWKLVFPLFVINLFFLPFILLEFRKYSYVVDRQIFGISKEEMTNMTETLGEYYEKKYKILYDINQEYEIINDKINNLNESFNENYIK